MDTSRFISEGLGSRHLKTQFCSQRQSKFCMKYAQCCTVQIDIGSDLEPE